MSSEDKSILIAGVMFLGLSTALFITGMFFMKALGTALLTALVTYVFFDQYYYKIKDWMLSANSKQSECTQNYSYFKDTKLFGGSQLWLKSLNQFKVSI